MPEDTEQDRTKTFSIWLEFPQHEVNGELLILCEATGLGFTMAKVIFNEWKCIDEIKREKHEVEFISFLKEVILFPPIQEMQLGRGVL